MPALVGFPNLNCIHVGAEPCPTNAPADLPSVVRHWVLQVADLTRPALTHWCDGTYSERESLVAAIEVLAGGARPTAIPRRRSHPRPASQATTDQQVVEHASGLEAAALRHRTRNAFDGCMSGQTMFVAPVLLDEPGELVAIEITDSPAAVLDLAGRAVIGGHALDLIATGAPWLRFVHTAAGRPGSRVVKFSDTGEVWAYGTADGALRSVHDAPDAVSMPIRRAS